MALHTETPLYLWTVELIKMIYAVSHHAPREYKYTLMQDIRRDSMNLTRCIKFIQTITAYQVIGGNTISTVLHKQHKTLNNNN